MTRNSAGLDDYYTPAWAAEALARVLPDSLTGGVLDPAAGGGALLKAVELRFGPSVSLLGIDVSNDAVRKLRELNPKWSVSNADLLRAPSRSACRAWRTARGGALAAVLMNPPFSYRGNSGAVVQYANFRGRVAPSMLFLTEVLRSLDPTEGFFAILPDGALDAERHRELWQQIQVDYSVERLMRLGNSSFRGARVSTSIVRLRAWRHATTVPSSTIVTVESPPTPHDLSSCRCVEVVRGRVQVHSLPSLSKSANSAPFIHTTDLESTTLERSAPERLADVAPLVLLSRVGKWRKPRLVEVGHVVLSDCLFGIRPRSKAGLIRLVAGLPSIELDLQLRLRGTGAPYLTLGDVKGALSAAGWHVHVAKASTRPGDCCCGSVFPACDAGSEMRERRVVPSAMWQRMPERDDIGPDRHLLG